MKKIKKLTTITLSLTLAAASLAGCSTSKSVENSQGEREDTYNYTGEGPITDQENASISILATNSWYSTVDLTSDDALIVKEVEKRAGVDVDWTMIDPTTYTDAVSPMLASGTDLQDIVSLPDLDLNSSYIKSALFEPLDTHFDLMPNYKAYLEANPEVKASLTAEDGHIYYVPTIGLADNYLPCVMYNQKWLDQLNMEQPKTLDDFVTMLRAFRDNDMNGNGDTTDEIPMSVKADFLPSMFGPAFGLDLDNGFYVDENSIVHYAYYESENYKKYLSFLNELYTEGLLEMEYTSLTRDQITERFAQNMTGVTFDYSWQMSQLYSKQFQEYDQETGIVVGGEPLSGEYEGAYVAINPVKWIYGVTTDSKNQNLAIKFLDFAMSEECQKLYAWGIENETYTVTSKGDKEFTEKALSDNLWLQTLGINPACLPYHNSIEATNVLLPQWHVDIDEKLATKTRKPWPQIYATQEETSVLSQYLVDIETYVEQMSVAFITGNTNMNEFDNYISSLKSMHVEDIIKIKQDQYNRYLAALE
ncbi:extracellular solute-binding protein [Lachnotalea glycerini]|uniref:Extracellular solute-binding protein n=1 Tax=Lachnotalea glycerini TaxID=1763509 RepID=A0A371J2A4_9FIRM|nr:extracellular solute-binding protein [Lachnotalea glycerini]RDY26824.1 extracellular solute-binding protein [Lachnotalea glycerini]